MRLRSKILLLLLTVSAIPTIIAGTIGFLSLVNLGSQMATETSQSLLKDAEVRLQELAYENGSLVGIATEQLDMAVRVQQVAALAALTSTMQDSQPIVHSEDFDSPETSPSDVLTFPMFDAVLEDGTTIPSLVSFQTQAITQPVTVPKHIASLQAKQLNSMNPTYKALSVAPGVPAMRYYTATIEGMIGSFPGHGGMPKDYDPTQRDWFKAALQSGGQIIHMPPKVDASTRRIVVASVAPIIDVHGNILGVTGAERSVVDVLHSIYIPKVWQKDAIIRVVFPQNGNLVVIASQDMVDGALAWNSSPSVEVLSDGSKEFSKLYAGINTGQQGCIDMHNEGVDLFAAFAPIKGMQAAIVIWVPHVVIAAEAIAEEKLVRAETQEHAIVIGSVASIIILIVIFIALFVSKLVSRPIIALTQATTSITKGDFNVSVENWGKDEIGELTRNFNTMVPQLKERLELRESLEVAKQIQQCLLPTSDPTFSGWEITGKSMYCDATGGDYYDFISPIDDDSHLRLALGDVTGHGIASALMMATARSLLRGGVRSGDDPVERLNHVNNSLVNDTPLGWFMTFFCLELQANSGEVHWVSAGHDPAIVVDLDGTVSELEGEDIPLGVTANWSFTGKGPTIIKPDAVIVLGTDGIWEARNEEGEMYDKPRMIEVILNHRTKPVAVICDAVTQAVLEFCGTAPRRDDITMLVARRVCDGSDPQSLS